ncbi:MAG: phosphoribosyltransferase [Elusimicrobia bacterium]|nr:phosphoribosyltransferase [Elusimicrobiota bacterium]
MSQNEILEMLSGIGAVITGSHIVYTSGKHGSAYVNKDAIYPHTRETSRLCRALAERFAQDGVEAVLAPAVGGVILSQWVAHHLTELKGREVLGLYAEKSEDGRSFVIKRGYDRLLAGRRILVVEDVLTTGGSVRKVVDGARALGAVIIGVAALCNRGGVLARDLGEVPRLEALINISLESWEERDCPLCAKGEPVNTGVGKGREFLARRKLQ